MPPSNPASADPSVDAPWAPPTRTVQMGGSGSIQVRDSGAQPGRPTVLLLHGWAVTADVNWFTTYRMLAERYRVIAMDHRGHGKGLRPSNGIVRLSDCADDAAEGLRAMEIDQAVIVGYSMGGAIAQLMWRRQPDRVAGLVLASTARRFKGGPLSDVWYRAYTPLARAAHVAEGPAEKLVQWRVERRVQDEPQGEWMRRELRQASPAGILSSMRSLGRFSSVDWLDQVDVPTSVIVTTKDRIVPPWAQNRLAAAVPNSRRFAVDGPHDAVVTNREAYLPVLGEAIAHAAST